MHTCFVNIHLFRDLPPLLPLLYRSFLLIFGESNSRGCVLILIESGMNNNTKERVSNVSVLIHFGSNLCNLCIGGRAQSRGWRKLFIQQLNAPKNNSLATTNNFCFQKQLQLPENKPIDNRAALFSRLLLQRRTVIMHTATIFLLIPLSIQPPQYRPFQQQLLPPSGHRYAALSPPLGVASRD